MERCQNGHYYDPAHHSICPTCGVGGITLNPSPTAVAPPLPTPQPPVAATPAAGALGKTQKINMTPQQTPEAAHAGKTVALYNVPQQGNILPVTGWLVCTEGADKGKDFRLHPERNFIGRSSDMDVQLSDESVSREKHAIISYNPLAKTFKLIPGESRALVYCNGEEVDMPKLLDAKDVIQLGKTKLLFIPLCGTSFDWEN